MKNRSSRRVAVECLEGRSLFTAVAVTTPLPALTVGPASGAASADLSAYFSGADVPANTVFFSTTQGLIPVQLTPDATPATVANFLGYVDSGTYDGTFVHRSIADFIWQGGGYTATSDADGNVTDAPHITENAPVVNEYAASHPNVRGTIAMAKLPTGPDTATSEWFFNEADNRENLDNQNGGFTTFGGVIGNGLAVVDAIAALSTINAGSSFTDLPVSSQPVADATGATHIKTSSLVTINSIREAAAYTVTSSNPAAVTAAVGGSTLTYTPVGLGTSTLTVTATGVDGTTAAQSFAVNVTDGSTPTPTPGVTPAVSASTVPAAVVAGAKVKGKVKVGLTNTAAAASKGVATVDLYAVPAGTTDPAAGTLVGTARRRVNLATGASATLAVAVRSLPTTDGTYTLLARATDVNGTVIDATTGPTVTVAPATILLTGTLAFSPTAVTAGDRVTFTLTLGNSGNVASTGKLTVAVGLSADGSAITVPVKSLARAVSIKPGGKSVTIRVSGVLPKTATAGSFLPLAELAQGPLGGSTVVGSAVTVGVS